MSRRPYHALELVAKRDSLFLPCETFCDFPWVKQQAKLGWKFTGWGRWPWDTFILCYAQTPAVFFFSPLRAVPKLLPF